MRYAGIKDNKIKLISNHQFSNSELEIIQIPEYLESIPSSNLIEDFRYKNNKFLSKKLNKPLKEIKLAFITNWAMDCGIAVYGKKIFSEIIKNIGDFKLFIEENDFPTENIYQINDQFYRDKVLPCWKRGQSLNKLANSIIEYEPDIILINHEWGLFPDAKNWLSLLTQLSDYRIITILHSVFHHQDKSICEAPMSEIITHLEGGARLLKEDKQISGKVYVIPHGCDSLSSGKLWNIYKTEQTFVQFGFGFRYKNFENSIKATAILKEKYPNIFFTAVFSESQYSKSEHQSYYNELSTLVKELNVQSNVGIVRGFQTDYAIDSYLRTNKVAVFPYRSSPGHQVFGASGASRLAMSKNLPIITSSIPHFSDLPSIKADSPEEIAQKLDFLFSNPQNIEEQLNKQALYIQENSWQNVAQLYLNIMENNIFANK